MFGRSNMSQPDTPSSMSDAVALGNAFAARAVACAAMAQAQLLGFKWTGRAPSADFVESREATLLISNMMVGRWLITGQVMSKEEVTWLGIRGTLAAAEGLSIVNVTRSYLCWRDVTAQALREEAARLGTPAEVLEMAIASVRQSADAAIIRMARAFDEETERLREVLATEREAFRHKALHDPLTGLPNRVLLHDRLQQAINAARRQQSRVALLMIDLDRFKAVNDDHGHEAGDFVLKAVADCLAGNLRGSDTVARLGGDEFALVLPGCDTVEIGLQAAGKVVSLLGRPLQRGEAEHVVGASVGIAFFPDHGIESEELLNAADRAMYRAKRGAATEHRLAGHVAVAT